MSSDEEQDREQDHEQDQEQEQDQVRSFPKSGYSSASQFVPGFGFDGPSEAWKRARGLTKPTYVGGSGTAYSDAQAPQPVVEAQDTEAREQDALRRERFLQMLDRKQPEVQLSPQKVQPQVHTLSPQEEAHRRQIASLRERGLEESKRSLDQGIRQPEMQVQKERVLSQAEIQRQKHLTQWIDNQKPEEAEIFRVQFEGLRTLYRERTKPDVWIEVDSGERVGAHKVVLVSRSQVFNSMLCSHMQEEASNTVHMGGFSVEAVESMVEYLYTGTLTTDTHHILELLYLSSAYFLSGLKTSIERKLSRMVTGPQVIMLLEAAEATDSWQLYEEIVNFCLTSKIEIQRAGAWSQLSPEFKRDLALRTNLAA